MKIASKHLKSCFPELKIGGPAVASNMNWANDFLAEMKKRGAPLDFFSWHIYSCTVEKVRARIEKARELLDKHGFTETESILNEWNYVKGWEGDNWTYSLDMMKDLKSASFIGAVMLMSQSSALDNLMYYDARPGGMNCLFDTSVVSRTLKGYHTFYMFNQLYKLGTQVEAASDIKEDLWFAAADGNSGERCFMLTHYNDDDNTPPKDVKLTFKNVSGAEKVRLEYYLLDRECDAKLVREEIFTASEFSSYINIPVYSTYLLKIVNI